MKSFLQIVAEDLLATYGNDMRQVTVVFPSRRASSFLFQELSRVSETPVWAPHCVTIGELFHQLSPYIEADRMQTICQLFTIYRMVLFGADEAIDSLDRFWSWGEVLLNDFNDVDKHRAPAHEIFSLIRDNEALRDLSHLDEKQREALQRFLNFTIEQGSLIQRRFMLLWDHVNEIYDKLRDEQKSLGALYQGALQRDVIENQIDPERLQQLWPHICFVGFNVLNNVEEDLMQACKDYTDARFYWDYDRFYLDNTQFEAGFFIQHYIKRFPMPQSLSSESFDNLKNLSNIHIVATTTDDAQARYASHFAASADVQSDENRSSIVLCDEHLLLPLMHSLPQTDVPVNITMGFPLSDTPVYTFLSLLLDMQIDGYDANRQALRYTYQKQVFSHAYFNLLPSDLLLTPILASTPEGVDATVLLLRYLQDVTRRLAVILSAEVKEVHAPLGETNLPVLYSEAAYVIHRTLLQFIQVIQNDKIPFSISIHTLRRLFRQALQGVNIPFHGDQTEGLQVMGVLESRCLDFKNLLMLSLEEDKLPKRASETSFIMPVIREAFQLTTMKQQMCIYSYYFFRLLQRAENVTLVYNENTSDNQRHEISRFLRQLQAETAININYHRLSTEPHVETTKPLEAEGSEHVKQLLLNRFDHNTPGHKSTLSPTALVRYMHCPMRFYYTDVARLYPETSPEEGIDNSMLGTLFHAAAEAIYRQIIIRQNGDNLIKKETLSTLLKDKDYHRFILDVVTYVYYLHGDIYEGKESETIQQILSQGQLPEPVAYKGRDIIIMNVLLRFIQNLLKADLQYAPFHIICMEEEVQYEMQLEGLSPAKAPTLHLGGRIDRLDMKDGVWRVVDYKTGSSSDKNIPKDIDDVFSYKSKNKGYYLQAMLYTLAVQHRFPSAEKVETVLFYPRENYENDNVPPLKIAKSPLSDHLDAFEEKLNELVTMIFQTERFTQSKDKECCKYCPFAHLC